MDENKVSALAQHLRDRDIELNSEGLGTTIHCKTYYRFMAMGILDFLEQYNKNDSEG